MEQSYTPPCPLHKKCGGCQLQALPYPEQLRRKQGRENAFWVILDYSDIVVHIFLTDQRLFYRLEDLWADAVKTEYTD